MALIEAIVETMYDKPTTKFDINESRLELCVSKQRGYDKSPLEAGILKCRKVVMYRDSHT